jgi:segregation and condensation protein A
MSYRVRTQAFSGPFDLLLQLVSRQRVDIGAISIADVADQYLDEVDRMRDMDLDVASDFVLVASTLLEIKAASLVPDDFRVKPAKDDPDEDEDDLSDLTPDEAREVLIARLIAYKQFRNAGSALGARMEAASRMHPRTAGADPDFLGLMPDYLEGITLRGLAVICADLDSRKETLLLEAEHIAPRRLPVALTVASVDRITRSKHCTTFTELLDGQESPEQIVVTLLAVLELYKLGSIRMQQNDLFGEIDIVRVEGAAPYVPSDEDLTSVGEEQQE